MSPYYLATPAEGGDHGWYMKLKMSDKIPVAGFLKPNQMLAEGFSRWLQMSGSATDGSLNLHPGEPVSGCDGTLTGSIEQGTNGKFSGLLSFDGYADDCSMHLDGEVSLKGGIDPASNELEVRMELAKLQARIGKKPLQLGGELRLRFAANPSGRKLLQAESRLRLADENGPRYNLSPVNFTWDRRGTYPAITMDGRIRFFPYGNVELKTTSPLQLLPPRELPFDGSLRVYGAEESWIRMLFNRGGDPGFFRIDGSDGLRTIGHL